ncbi:MAG TPA: OmpH family outer membrane protein [Armatimonadota bacterium]|nr:OmpH family outer membrane protein [Armatimonadota bacterium]
MTRSRGISAVLVSVVLLAIIAGPVFSADTKQQVGLIFGTADADSLFKDYTKRQQLYSDLDALKARLEGELELRNANRLLTDDEFKQLVDLQAKAQKTDAEQKKIDELLGTSKQRDQDLQALQQKSNATDAEKTQRAELENRLKAVQTALQDNKTKFEEELNKQLIEANQQVTQDIEAAVTAVAKEKGLTVVFNKSLQFILYSSVDITPDVLKKLNKK